MKAPALSILLMDKKDKSKEEPVKEKEADDFTIIAEELMALAKEDDPEGFAAALKDFVWMCMENKE